MRQQGETGLGSTGLESSDDKVGTGDSYTLHLCRNVTCIRVVGGKPVGDQTPSREGVTVLVKELMFAD